jgi:2,3-bisphosphoglycerate-independent phosphoglycerate mutase
MVSPAVLVVPDGASEPIGDGPTSLEEAHTPVLDKLASSRTLVQVRTIPDGLPAGTEVGLPTLLGLALDGAPSRGRIEAAAAGVPVGPDEGAWRLDVLEGRGPAEVADDDLAALDDALSQFGGSVIRLRGHRLLLIGPAWWGDGPPGPHQTDRQLRDLAVGPFGGVAKAARTALGRRRVAWPWGTLARGLPERSDRRIVLVAGSAAAVGMGRLLGWEVVPEVPDPLPEGALVVVHVPDADEAAHARDRAAKVAALERLDTLLGDLLDVDPNLAVCPDHGCDPATGAHTREPVPALNGGERRGPARRFTERAAATEPLREAL